MAPDRGVRRGVGTTSADYVASALSCSASTNGRRVVNWVPITMAAHGRLGRLRARRSCFVGPLSRVQSQKYLAARLQCALMNDALVALALGILLFERRAIPAFSQTPERE